MRKKLRAEALPSSTFFFSLIGSDHSGERESTQRVTRFLSLCSLSIWPNDDWAGGARQQDVVGERSQKKRSMSLRNSQNRLLSTRPTRQRNNRKRNEKEKILFKIYLVRPLSSVPSKYISNKRESPGLLLAAVARQVAITLVKYMSQKRKRE